jgi:NTP pyrophosphatase (non-canonical NTP hydrolase)
MSKGFLDILAIARENVRKNPSLQNLAPEAVATRYLSGLQDEVEEVQPEVRQDNSIYLEDELSDIAWDYACLLAQLERCGYIESVEAVLAHGFEKYSERTPAFLEGDQTLWNDIKAKQKASLKTRHTERYGT